MFTTKIDIQPSVHKIEYASKIMTLGSCFSENIGTKLKNACFDTDVNPFGVLYNPASIAENIQSLMEKKIFTSDDLFQYNSLWGSYMHSTLYSDSKAERCLSKINKRLLGASDKLQQTDYLLLTFGTAWIYKLTENGKVVANCHKLPAEKFIRERLSVETITQMYDKLLLNIKTINPKIKIVFTVSPVRHWKDGPTENNISKGILLQAIQEIVNTHKNTIYFPAYEIVIDELRDYRYYAADMLHPSDVAVDYIFNTFSNTFFDKKTLECMQQVTEYQKSVSHRPIHTDTIEYEKFTNYLLSQKQKLLTKYSILNGRI